MGDPYGRLLSRPIQHDLELLTSHLYCGMENSKIHLGFVPNLVSGSFKGAALMSTNDILKRVAPVTDTSKGAKMVTIRHAQVITIDLLRDFFPVIPNGIESAIRTA